MVSWLFKNSLFSNDVAILSWGTPHTTHLHIIFHFRERQTQIHTTDSNPGAPFWRPSYWGHLYGKEKALKLIT